MKDQRLGDRFYLEKELGSGGMATVYLGTDEVLDRPVAVKVLKPDLVDSDVGVRFRREGRTAARLSHPNIVQVYDAREEELDGKVISYIVMEYVSGGDLKGLISDRGTLLGGEISKLSGAADGLSHAHERGIIHRDIKPHNILLDENRNPKLADFGIARALDATQATKTGAYMGTARYSSPEQLKGEGVTTKSDIYSFGATLYEAVAGEPPFSGTPIEIASQHVSKPPTPPGDISPLDEDLENLILSCLSKDPEDRPTATRVRDLLSKTPLHFAGATKATNAGTVAQTGGTVSGPRSTSAQPAASGGTRNYSRRRTPLIVALVGLLVLLGGLGVFALLSNDEPRAQAPPATTQEEQEEPTQDSQDDGQQAEQTTAAVEPEPQEPAPAPTTPQPSEPGAEQEPKEGGAQSGGISQERAAAQAVQSVYKLAADGDYQRSYSLLTQNAKQQTEAYTLAQWSGQFDTLQRIRFIEGPDAEVSGNTATVTGVTRAEHTNRTERNTVTWTMVRRNGEWKLDRINSFQQELI